jgi:hypothetical protein
MTENALVKFEPRIRSRPRARPKPKLKPRKSKTRPRKLGLHDILGSGPLALSAGLVQAGVSYWEWRDRRKLHQTLLLIAGALVILIGVSRLAVQLIHS